jgi:hypothetical protein
MHGPSTVAHLLSQPLSCFCLSPADSFSLLRALDSFMAKEPAENMRSYTVECVLYRKFV